MEAIRDLAGNGDSLVVCSMYVSCERVYWRHFVDNSFYEQAGACTFSLRVTLYSTTAPSLPLKAFLRSCGKNMRSATRDTSPKTPWS